MLIFEKNRNNRYSNAQLLSVNEQQYSQYFKIPAGHLRKSKPLMPEVSELDVVRHYTNLSRKNFSIDTQFYPLGSCTMKYNPRGAHKSAMLPGFLGRHPLAPPECSQGVLACFYDLQNVLAEVTGMQGVSLSPMAGAQGEFAGVAMIKAYHAARNDIERTEILVPTAAHGTNPATATMCGFTVREIPVTNEGDVDVEALREAVGPKTAGLMLTNPSTCGVFERGILKIAEIVHQAGGLLYYDGANLNAVVGKIKPGEMGFDVLHINLHKTFATPHGGGGPGSGPVAVNNRLLPYLPTPFVVKEDKKGQAFYRFSTPQEVPSSIGRLSTFMGNAGVLLRAYFYAAVLGKEGLKRVAEIATLNANYLMKAMEKAGFHLAYPSRRASHEFIITFKQALKEQQLNAMDFAKRLLDYGYHAPTTYFPLLVPECWLIEPTETESKETLDEFVDALKKILQEAQETPELIKKAPHTLPVTRLDDVKAAKTLDVVWEIE